MACLSVEMPFSQVSDTEMLLRTLLALDLVALGLAASPEAASRTLDASLDQLEKRVAALASGQHKAASDVWSGASDVCKRKEGYWENLHDTLAPKPWCNRFGPTCYRNTVDESGANRCSKSAPSVDSAFTSQAAACEGNTSRATSIGKSVSCASRSLSLRRSR